MDNSKKILTGDIIKQDLRKSRRSFSAYSNGVVIAVCGIVLLVCGNVLGVAVIVLGLLKMLKIAFEDALKTIGNYYVLERPCINGRSFLYEDDATEYRLFFKKKGKKPVYVKVEEDYYNECNVGEEFYVVFLKGQRHPCLCYSKNEWTM